MTSISTSERLAKEVEAGKYVPTALDACDATLTLERAPQVVRFAEFTLFTERRPPHYSEPRYLVLQSQRAQTRSTAARLELTFRKRFLEPFLRRWESELPTTNLPDPRRGNVKAVRGAIRGLAAELPASSELPPLDLPDRELRARFGAWVSKRTDWHVRDALSSIEVLCGAQVRPPAFPGGLTVGDLGNAIVDLQFPGPFQPFGSLHSPVALCATFEQLWELRGYTRGDLVSTLSLAPGEQLAIEIHTWDKSTRKSEEELATESEMRTSEKITQRDALTVSQEFAQQQDTKVQASGTIPIPKMPIGVGVQTASQTRESLKRTTESLREQVLEASTTLKLNRKTRIEVSRETGRDEKQTRVLENTNRCHSLNCHHFEVVANYLVRTRLASVRPCILLRYPRPVFTVNWILCHEGTLIRTLLDRTFLPGFDGARRVKIVDTVAELEKSAALAELESLGEQIAPFTTAIVEAYALLTYARDYADAIFADVGPNNAYQIASRLGPVNLERLFSYYALPPATRIALDGFSDEIGSGGNAATALRALFTSVSSDLPPQSAEGSYYYIVVEMNNHFQSWDSNPRFSPTKDLLLYDDGGLRAATAAAAEFLRGTPVIGTPGPDTSPEVAEAHVELERLQCHLNANWLHYAQSVWVKEDHDQRFLRLQSYGPIATLVENELLGFYGDRGAFPLRNVAVIGEINLRRILAEARREIASSASEPVLISMPTPGMILEAVTGECDACEDFIRESRLIDLRMQKAKAKQEEAEADRRRQRLVQGDLSDPEREAAGLVVEVRGLPLAGGATQGETPPAGPGP